MNLNQISFFFILKFDFLKYCLICVSIYHLSTILIQHLAIIIIILDGLISVFSNMFSCDLYTCWLVAHVIWRNLNRLSWQTWSFSIGHLIQIPFLSNLISFQQLKAFKITLWSTWNDALWSTWSKIIIRNRLWIRWTKMTHGKTRFPFEWSITTICLNNQIK